MRFNKVILGLACFFVYVALLGNYAVCQDAKGKGGKQVAHTGGPNQPYVPSKGPGAKDELEYDVQSAVEELKLLTTDVNKKSQVNRNILVGTTLVNTVLLLVISGLIGYSLKEKKEDNGSGSKKGKKGDKSGSEGGSGSGSGGEEE